MATKHRRIAVVRDPELDRALLRAAPHLGADKPAATLVRELALRGADAVIASPGDEAVRRILAAHGGRPADGSMADFLDARGDLGEPDPERRASKLLADLRAERLP